MRKRSWASPLDGLASARKTACINFSRDTGLWPVVAVHAWARGPSHDKAIMLARKRAGLVQFIHMHGKRLEVIS